MKKTSVIILVVFILLSTLVLLLSGVAHKQEGENDAMQDEKTIRLVGNAIEGTYSVFVSFKYVGELVIQQGNYSLSLINISSEIGAENFFYRYPKGTYEIKEYYGTVTPSSILEDLENNEILLQIVFFSGDGVSKSYLIRNDKVNQEVYFHSIINEIQLWEIRKSWDS